MQGFSGFGSVQPLRQILVQSFRESAAGMGLIVVSQHVYGRMAQLGGRIEFGRFCQHILQGIVGKIVVPKSRVYLSTQDQSFGGFSGVKAALEKICKNVAESGPAQTFPEKVSEITAERAVFLSAGEVSDTKNAVPQLDSNGFRKCSFYLNTEVIQGQAGTGMAFRLKFQDLI